MLGEFKSFLTKSNALALALGVIIGGATGKVVDSVVEDLLMPPIGLVMPKGDWRDAHIVLSKGTDETGKSTLNSIRYGHFVGSLVDFVLIAGVVFLVTRSILPPDPPAPATRTCPECLESVPKAAKRCRACTSVLAPV